MVTVFVSYPCLSLSPFINWFDLLTRLDTTPESLMLSEDHFSRGCFKSHSVWLAKITFFTGRGCAESVGPEQGGRGGQKFVPAVKKLYELQIFNFLRRWKVSRLKFCLNDLDRVKMIAICFCFRGKSAIIYWWLLEIGVKSGVGSES